MNATNSATLQIVTSGAGAFFGAFFAFLFGLVTYYWTKWLERQNKDYNAMVQLECILNQHLNTQSRNEFLIHGSIDSLKNGAMTYNLLRPYRLVDDIELSFLDLDLINKYFEYRDSVNSLNNDFETTNKANDILREVVLSGKHNDVTIRANAQQIIGNLTAIKKMTSANDDETKSLLCLIRIKIRHDKPGLIGISRVCWEPYKPTDQEKTEEMNKLEKEILETKENSAKTILKNLNR